MASTNASEPPDGSAADDTDHTRTTVSDASELNRDEELALELVADAVGDRAAKLLARADADPQRVVALRR